MFVQKSTSKITMIAHPNSNQKIYFPNLNGLRFIAALFVIIHHIEQIKSILKYNNYWDTWPFVHELGIVGVNLFFVLSGFLITYLLLEEEQQYKTIYVRKFYMRRILRIWPLYYLIVVLAFFVLPNLDLFILPGYGKQVIYSNLFLRLFLYSIFLPNLVQPLLGIVPFVSHTWSIGTEEQFYLIWPIVLKFVKKHRIALMLLIIILYLMINILLQTSSSNFIPYKSVVRGFWMSFNINCMAFGGLFSILLFQKSKLLTYLQNHILCYISILIVVLLMFKIIDVMYFQQEIYAALFSIIILNFATNIKIKISLENKYFRYLGNISYGLYMYHPIAIIFALALASFLNITSNWLIYPISILISIIMAAFSYKYFESYFLKVKNKYQV